MFSERSREFLAHRGLVAEAAEGVFRDLSEGYRSLADILSDDGPSWFVKADWAVVARTGYVQIRRKSWPPAIHLTFNHDVKSILSGYLTLDLHVERPVLDDAAAWPLVGNVFLNEMQGESTLGIELPLFLPAPSSTPDIVSMASRRIPLEADWAGVVRSMINGLNQFAPVVRAVDYSIWHHGRRVLFRTRFRKDDPLLDLKWGDPATTGGQEIVLTGGMYGGPCLGVFQTGRRFNHTRQKASILSVGRFQGLAPGARVYLSICVRTDGNVTFRPLADGKMIGAEWINPWAFDEEEVHTHGQWTRKTWVATALSLPGYDVTSEGGTQYLLTDTGDGAAHIDEIEFGVLEN